MKQVRIDVRLTCRSNIEMVENSKTIKETTYQLISFVYLLLLIVFDYQLMNMRWMILLMVYVEKLNIENHRIYLMRQQQKQYLFHVFLEH